MTPAQVQRAWGVPIVLGAPKPGSTCQMARLSSGSRSRVRALRQAALRGGLLRCRDEDRQGHRSGVDPGGRRASLRLEASSTSRARVARASTCTRARGTSATARRCASISRVGAAPGDADRLRRAAAPRHERPLLSRVELATDETERGIETSAVRPVVEPAAGAGRVGERYDRRAVEIERRPDPGRQRASSEDGVRGQAADGDDQPRPDQAELPLAPERTELLLGR